MSVHMTHPAFRELCYHRRRMRRTVATFAGRHVFMTFLVAERAGERRVFGWRSRQHVRDRLVTGRAILVRHIRTVRDDQRHVGRMAHRAIFVAHIGRVRLVAFQTFRDISVSLVACSTEKLGMSARVFLRLIPLLDMAGEAGGRQIRGELHVEWRVGIGMTGIATTDFVVRFARMARTTERDDFLFCDHRRVSLVATGAGYRRFVFGTFTVDNRLDARVAFHAIRVQQLRRLGCLLFCSEREEKSGKSEHDERNHKDQASRLQRFADLHCTYPLLSVLTSQSRLIFGKKNVF